MTDNCGDMVGGPTYISLLVSYWLEAFSHGFFIFMQPHLEFQQEMCPMSLHFYLGIFQNVITTTTYIFVAHKALA
jgi:hypothetical protein